MTKNLQAPLESKTLVDRIVDRVVGAILAGELPLGGKLREQALAQSLGVSRGPLREAIRRLEGRGLIERVPNRGPRVISLTSTDLMEIYTIREVLEGVATRQATELMSDADLIKLTKLLDKQEEQIRRQNEPLSLGSDLDFHSRIIDAAGSRRLKSLVNDALFDMLRIYRARSEAVPGRGARAVDEHRQVVAAMKKRDAAKAEELMRRHIRTARDNLLERIRRHELKLEAAPADPTPVLSVADAGSERILTDIGITAGSRLARGRP